MVTGQPGTITAALSGVTGLHPARRAGAEQGIAPGGARGVSSVQGKPQGSRGSLADPPVPQRTDPEATVRDIPLHRGMERAKSREGDRGDAGCCNASEWRASEGDAPGPRQGGVTTPVPGRRSSSDPASRCLSPYVLRAWGAETSRQGIASGSAACLRTDAGAPQTGARSGLGSA